MLERTIATNEENSKFFQHNNNIVKLWESFAEEVKGEITGEVNSFMIEFLLKYKAKNREISIIGESRVANRNTGSSTGYLLEKSTKIAIEPYYSSLRPWTITTKRKVKDFFAGFVTKTESLSYNSRYTLSANRYLNKEQLINKDTFDTIEKIAKLWKISYKSNLLEIEYSTLIGPDAARKLISIL